MVQDTILPRASLLSVAVALGLLCSQSLVAGEVKLDFCGDFDWAVGEITKTLDELGLPPQFQRLMNGRLGQC